MGDRLHIHCDAAGEEGDDGGGGAAACLVLRLPHSARLGTLRFLLPPPTLLRFLSSPSLAHVHVVQ